MLKVRMFGLLVTVIIGLLATVAGAAKGPGGGGVVAAPGTDITIDLSPVALPTCTGSETNTVVRPGVCQTAAPILFVPADGVIPIPIARIQQGTRLRLSAAALDPVKFPVNGCTAEYHIGSVSATGPLVAALAPEIGNIADFRTTVPAGTVTSGAPASIDVVCNFTGPPVRGRRGVIITPGAPMHSETHWAGVL